jgi:uncharacterized protein Usg
VQDELKLQLAGYSLVAARIIYHMPDHPNILQEYIWQEYDCAPEFPKLKKFCDFWQKNLDGKIKEVLVTYRTMIGASEIKVLDDVFNIN